MGCSLLQASISNKGLYLDPRTKFFVLINFSIFVLGSAGGQYVQALIPLFCALPALLLFFAKKWKHAIIYILLFSISFFSYEFFGKSTNGFLHFLLLTCSGILARFLPGIMLASYIISTTTVSEFTAAMLRLKISEKIIIPLSVMFRFFPTVFDEAASINAAMKMRGIHIGGKQSSKIIEYKFIPLMICCVKIGEELSASALTRGLRADIKRTNICKIGFKIQDYILIILNIIPYFLWLADLMGVKIK